MSMADLMLGFRVGILISDLLCQVKKKFKDLQVGDILLVTKDRELLGIRSGFFEP